MFDVKKEKKPAKKDKKEIKRVRSFDLRKIDFYEFRSSVDPKQWKGKDVVPFFSELEEKKCQKCNGSGTELCKRCKGNNFIECSTCKGSGKITCKECKGRGEVPIEINVFDQNNKKQRKTIHVQCPKCFGQKYSLCKDCWGTGKILCPSCKGNPVMCKECQGTGVFFEYKLLPVPFDVKAEVIPQLIALKEDEKLLNVPDIKGKIKTVDKVIFNSVKQLDEKALKELLGVPNLEKEQKNLLKNVINTFESKRKEYEKGKSLEKPLYPIELYFVLKMKCTTPKKKSFSLIAIGSKDRFTVVSPDF